MKVGDLVVRKGQLGIKDLGLVLAKKMAGRPAHPCVTVFYPKTGKTYDMAESLMELAYEC